MSHLFPDAAVPPAPSFWHRLIWLAGIGLLLIAGAAVAQAVSLRDVQVLERNLAHKGIPIGGLSGIDYDPAEDIFYAISDDRAEHGPARFYRIRMDARGTESNGGRGKVNILSATMLLAPDGQPFPRGGVDPEALRLAPNSRRIFWASEGNVRRGIPPALFESRADGTPLRTLPLPPHYLPSPEGGVRDNLAFESLAHDATSGRLYLAVENALVQDGQVADHEQGSLCRLLVLDAASGAAVAEYAYLTEPAHAPPPFPGLKPANGLVELLAYGDGTLLALERSYVPGAGNSIRLFRIDLAGATNVLDRQALAGSTYVPVTKRLIARIEQLGVRTDNIEAMSWGPRMANGRRSLVLVSDDNFSPLQQTQFIVLELAE